MRSQLHSQNSCSSNSQLSYHTTNSWYYFGTFLCIMTDPYDVGPVRYYTRIFVIGTITLLIFITNTIIAAVLIHSTSLSYNTKYLIGSLCVSDLLIGASFLCSLITAVSKDWIFGEELCGIITYGTAMLFAITLTTLTLMVVDKYLMVKYPLKYHITVTKRKILMCVFFIWIVPSLIVYVISVITGFRASYDDHICTCTVTFNSQEDSIHAVIASVVVGIIPIFSTYIFCYISIYRISKRHQLHIRTGGGPAPVNRVNTKGLKTIFIATGITFVCWVPMISIGLLTWVGVLNPTAMLSFVAYMFLFCNSFANWIIYTKTHSSYRKAQIKLLKDIHLFFVKLNCPHNDPDM